MTSRLSIAALLLALAGCTTGTPRNNSSAIGSIAPDFTLNDAHGGTVTLSKLTADKPTIIIFYLGYDCPHCVRHLRELANHLSDIQKSDGQIIAISADPIAATQQSIHDFGDFPFPLLSDPDKKVAGEFGLVLGKDAMLHGAFIVDTQRKIRFAIRSDLPYANTDELLKQLQLAEK